MTSIITWQPATTPPTHSRSVFIYVLRESGSYEVWIGYFDGQEWGDEHGFRVDVSHWAERTGPKE